MARNVARSPEPSPPSGVRGAVIAIVLLGAFGGALYWMYRENEATKTAAGKQRAVVSEGKLPAKMGASWKEMDDPTKDGWDTEVTASAADKVLKQFGKYLTDPEHLEASKLDKYLGESFACGHLIPESRTTVFQDDVFRIERARQEKAIAVTTPEVHRGAHGLANALRALTAPLQGARDIHTKFKLFRIVPNTADTFTTVQFVAYSGHLPAGMVEHNATWEMQWKLERKGAEKDARLLGIQVSDFELVHSKQQHPSFADCTKSVLDKNECYRAQFLKGMNTWLERIQDKRYYYLLGNPGLAIGDINGDGLEDLYVCQEEGLPNRLFLHQSDGSAKDVSEEWGVNWLHSSRSALFIDLDNDGKQDLVVAMVGHVVVCQNMGNRFEIRTILPTDGDTMSVSAADYNRDGKLDLYACVYDRRAALEERFDNQRDGTRGVMLSANAIANNGIGGGRNALFRNEGAWKFANVTAEVGMEADATMNRRYSFAACWEDYDNDGWPDLYVSNDYGVNQLFHNARGRFEEVSKKAGAEDDAFSMSASWADYDQDGWMDLYVGNMFSGAGNRITFQPKFQAGNDSRKKRIQRFARGNTLLRNVQGQFTDVSEEAGVTMGRWAWGCNFADLNNDGLEDILVANGYITTEDASDL
jgi:hypothetical protein